MARIPRPGHPPPVFGTDASFAAVAPYQRYHPPDVANGLDADESPSLDDLDAATTVVWTELPADLTPWVKLGLSYTVGETAPEITLRVVEDTSNYAEITALPEQMLALCEAVTNLCGIIPPITSARVDAAHRIAG
ncbi:MAG TPA: hypothetical protein VGS19_15750 [Streptosporangiaceae bacterium]|nr:hypothetical protein [Streptosporangiaceae bacterium]